MTRRAQHIACLIARTNQKRADTSPQQKSPKTAKEETFELGELIQVRNLAPKHKLESKWDKIFVITRIAPNAIHCVRWRLDLHPPYRLRQQPKEMGQMEERLVHPKDAKKWNSELPPYHVWDEELVNQLLNHVRDESLIEDQENMIDTSTASDASRPQASPHSSSSSDSPRPPGGTIEENPEEGGEEMQNPLMDGETIRERQDKESETLHADEYYEMAKEILQKSADGRRLWQAYKNNAQHYIILAEEWRKQDEASLMLPPRPHTLYDRLRQIIPEQRSRPIRQVYLTGALQRNIDKDLDPTMWDEEHLDEYE